MKSSLSAEDSQSYSTESSFSLSSSLPTTLDEINSKNALFTKTELFTRTLPPLTSSSHKGSSGRVGILGGSDRYTGAPYYAAMAALQTGVDLVYVFCAREACIPIKSYSPELMVQGVYSAQEFDDFFKKNNSTTIDIVTPSIEKLVHDMAQQVIDMLDRLHCLIIGPGLGRCPLVFKAINIIIQQASHRNLSLVIDADALYMLSLDEYQHIIPALAHRPMRNTILTPNVVEYNRLIEKIGSGSERTLNLKLNNIILLRKGSQDIIQSYISRSQSMICNEMGGLKRCGGLGDILSGCVGAFSAWNTILNSKDDPDDENASSTMNNLVLSCWFACCITKRATNQAFSIKRRSMAAPDVLEIIGKVMNDMESSSI